MENTNAVLRVEKENHIFDFSVRRDNVGFMVFLKQTTDLSEIKEQPFLITYKCSCKFARTEHAAIHETGRKYLKGWNNRARLGKDNPLL